MLLLTRLIECKLMILRLCHRDLDQLTENNSIPWPELYNLHHEDMEIEYTNLLGPSVEMIMLMKRVVRENRKMMNMKERSVLIG